MAGAAAAPGKQLPPVLGVLVLLGVGRLEILQQIELQVVDNRLGNRVGDAVIIRIGRGIRSRRRVELVQRSVQDQPGLGD